MIIKFALGNSAFKLFENAIVINYKTCFFIPETVNECIDEYKGDGIKGSYRIVWDDEVPIIKKNNPKTKFKVIKFNPKDPYHLNKFCGDTFCDTGHYEAYEHGDINKEIDGVKYWFIAHKNFSQVRYNLIRFIQDKIEYNVLSSYPIYLCNENGKTIETLRN